MTVQSGTFSRARRPLASALRTIYSGKKESTAFRQNSLLGRACLQAIKTQHIAIIHKSPRQCNAPSGSEWIIIALVILLLFGGKKIPELMRGLGKGVKSFKDGVNEAKEEINKAQEDLDKPAEKK